MRRWNEKGFREILNAPVWRRAGWIAILLTTMTAPYALAGAEGEAIPQAAVRMTHAARAPLLHAAAAGARLVAVGDYGIVILSDDGGESWRQAQTVPVRTTLTGVSFVDERRGWAVGHGGTVLRTTDGGDNWSLQYLAPVKDPLLSVWFESANHGFAVGAFGFAMETQDGGVSWKDLRVAEGEDHDRHFNRVFPGPDGAIFIAAEAGTAFRSDDRGRTWNVLKLPYEGSLWGGLTLADGTVLLYGMGGHAFRTRDKGTTWEAIATGTDSSLTDGIQLPDGRIVLVGLGGAVAFGNPDGSPLTALVRPDRHYLASVAQASGSALLVFGQGGAMAQSLELAK